MRENPYEAPASDNRSYTVNKRRSLARPLLYVVGLLGVIQGLIGLPVGLFVGPHILVPAGIYLLLGAAAMWVARRIR